MNSAGEMTMTSKIVVPFLLSFDGKGGFKPGRGEAGWTTTEFDTIEQARAWMAVNQPSRMPCWARF